jgi:N-alpha-acetyltransferase 35, NatC auxiliary subunit
LFTNVYIDAILMPAPTSISDADFIRNRTATDAISPMHTVLRAYCLGLLKACWYVNERIRLEHFYEVLISHFWYFFIDD